MLAAAGPFLLRHWKLIGIGLLCLALAIQTVRLGAANNRADRIQINLNECRQGRIDDRKAYEDAQRKAAELNKAEVGRIVGEQDRISNNVEADLRARLERLRSELRDKAAGGSSGSPGTSADGKAPGGIDEEARVCLEADELLRAAENEERHDQLITWINEQLKVER